MTAALALALVVPAAAQAGSGPDPTGRGHAPKKAMVLIDGTLTVGAQETLRVKRVPPYKRRRLKAFVIAPPAATICDTFSLDFFSGPCLPEPLHPVPGTRPLRANKKNRGSLTFVMPAGYQYIDFYDPLKSHPIYLVDGQTVGIEIDITYRPEPRSVVGRPLAYTSAVVQVPPTS
jgi:hypothetical protein